MIPEHRQRFTAKEVSLKDGRSVRLRALETRDGEALAEFYATVLPGDYRFYCPHPLDREHAMANAAKADSPTEIVIVVELQDRRIGGYGWLRWANPGDERSTFGLCIRRECQNSGLGRHLITRVLEIGKELAPPIIQLTVQKANARAVALYTRMGFHVVREQMRAAGFQPGLEAEPEYAMERPAR